MSQRGFCGSNWNNALVTWRSRCSNYRKTWSWRKPKRSGRLVHLWKRFLLISGGILLLMPLVQGDRWCLLGGRNRGFRKLWDNGRRCIWPLKARFCAMLTCRRYIFIQTTSSLLILSLNSVILIFFALFMIAIIIIQTKSISFQIQPILRLRQQEIGNKRSEEESKPPYQTFISFSFLTDRS